MNKMAAVNTTGAGTSADWPFSMVEDMDVEKESMTSSAVEDMETKSLGVYDESKSTRGMHTPKVEYESEEQRKWRNDLYRKCFSAQLRAVHELDKKAHARAAEAHAKGVPFTPNAATLFLPRAKACLLISNIALRLRLPWQTAATGCTLLHRYVRSISAKQGVSLEEASFPDSSYLYFLDGTKRQALSYACLLLASKVEETLFSLRVLCELLRGKTDAAVELAALIREMELQVLIGLRFDITVSHALRKVESVLKVLQCDDSLIREEASRILFDTMIEPFVLFEQPVLTAATAVSVAMMRKGHVSLSKNHKACQALSLAEWKIIELEGYILRSMRILEGSEGNEEVSGFGSPFSQRTKKPSVASGEGEEPTLAPQKLCLSSYRACRQAKEFDFLDTVNEGTYGTVYRAKEVGKKGPVVAVKKLKRISSRSGFPYYMLREILWLRMLDHPNIVRGDEILTNPKHEVFIVMEFIKQDMLKVLQSSSGRVRFTLAHVKSLMMQLLSALAYMHKQGLMHRDIKLSNLLFDDQMGLLKVADLGSVRDEGRKTLKLTTAVVTLWYRAPELLLGATTYTCSIDLWSVGCMLVELVSRKPLFPGRVEKATLDRIFAVKGRPSDDVWDRVYKVLPNAADYSLLRSAMGPCKLDRYHPQLGDSGLDLLRRMLDFDPDARITAVEALNHPFFKEDPLPQVPAFPRQKDTSLAASVDGTPSTSPMSVSS